MEEPQPRHATPAGFVGLYDFKETLGTGHYSVVKKAQHVISKNYVAVKIIEKNKLDEVELAHLQHEVRVMKLLRHPNVIRLYQVVDTPAKMFLILQLGANGDLYERIKTGGKVAESSAQRIFAQLVSALTYCHERRVAHRDLKPENIVFCTDPETEEEVVKVTDFGLCNNFHEDHLMETYCGSMVYSSPEVLLQEPYSGPKADVWSLGIVLFMLVAGDLPFTGSNDSELLTKLLDVRFDYPAHMSPDCRDLISKILVKSPADRLTMKQIEAHPWVAAAEGARPLSATVPLRGTTVTKGLHDRIVVVMEQAGISRAEVAAALESESYDHVASTYYLLAEQLRRESASASRPRSVTAGEGGAYSLSALVSPPATPQDPANESRRTRSVNTGGKRGSLRLRPRPLSANRGAQGSPAAASVMQDLASLALSPRLVPDMHGSPLASDPLGQTWPAPGAARGDLFALALKNAAQEELGAGGAVPSPPRFSLPKGLEGLPSDGGVDARVLHRAKSAGSGGFDHDGAAEAEGATAPGDIAEESEPDEDEPDEAPGLRSPITRGFELRALTEVGEEEEEGEEAGS